jgi:hypothetical protein
MPYYFMCRNQALSSNRLGKYYAHLSWINNTGRIIVVDEKESKALMCGCGEFAAESGRNVVVHRLAAGQNAQRDGKFGIGS